MSNALFSDYFLGANTPGGFCSMFQQSYSAADGWQIIIIKGGPGTGKSTLMRSVADKAIAAEIFTERIHCSSDPDSLDAVILPSLRKAIFDGTAPHVMEPQYPGACERILDLGQAWDFALLHRRTADITEYSRRCSECHRQASRMLVCAEVFRARLKEPALQAADRQKISRAADRLCQRFGLSRRSGSAGSVTRRLASAVTPNGITFAAEDYLRTFGTVVPLLDRSCVVSGLLLEHLRDRLLDHGHHMIECPCSQDHSRPEHLLLPEENICFTTRSDAHGLDSHTDSDTRAVRWERFLPESLTRGRHAGQAADRREMLRFTRLASDCMSRAKSIHDRLEDCYRDAVNFSVVEQLGEEAAQWMLG